MVSILEVRELSLSDVKKTRSDAKRCPGLFDLPLCLPYPPDGRTQSSASWMSAWALLAKSWPSGLAHSAGTASCWRVPALVCSHTTNF